MVDSLVGIQVWNNTLEGTGILAEILRGPIEYEGTTLRMTYTAVNAPGRRNVTGMYHIWRLGYDDKPVTLALLAPCLAFILVLSAYYSWFGLHSGTIIDGPFDPTNSVSLIVAGAAGGAVDGLYFADKGDISPENERIQHSSQVSRRCRIRGFSRTPA